MGRCMILTFVEILVTTFGCQRETRSAEQDLRELHFSVVSVLNVSVVCSFVRCSSEHRYEAKVGRSLI